MTDRSELALRLVDSRSSRERGNERPAPILPHDGVPRLAGVGRGEGAGTTVLEYHPLANLFPLIEGKDFDEFCAGIKADGIIHDKIMLLDGLILDGRNRYRACEAIRMTAHFETFDPNVHGDPLKYVIGKNLRRRHLTDDQRRMVAARLATMGPGRPGEEIFANGEVKREEAADLLSVDIAGVDRAKVVITKGAEELQDAVDAGEITVRAAADITKLTPDEQRDLVERTDPQIVKDVARKIREGDIGGARSIMASRHEPDDSLDYFPTPPWATRALAQHVLPAAGLAGKRFGVAWEPACGEGHIAAVLDEYADRVIATDIFDYGYGEVQDFLAVNLEPPQVDWLITNPPFGEHAIEFVDRALSMLEYGRVSTGVAMFFRSQWAVEGVERYDRIFRDTPPTLCAFFVERVNLCKGRWDPDGSTATAYCWLVWLKDASPRPTFWIPPGCRIALSEPGDRERFTAHPIAPGAASSLLQGEGSGAV